MYVQIISHLFYISIYVCICKYIYIMYVQIIVHLFTYSYVNNSYVNICAGPGVKVEHDHDVGAVIVGFDQGINYYKIQYAQLCVNENPVIKHIFTCIYIYIYIYIYICIFFYIYLCKGSNTDPCGTSSETFFAKIPELGFSELEICHLGCYFQISSSENPSSMNFVKKSLRRRGVRNGLMADVYYQKNY
jgi:hypothetical protein